MKYPDFTNALCREVGVTFFFPDDQVFNDTAIYSFARKICSGCEIKDKCLEWALHHEAHGMWGGTTPRERQALRKKNKILLNQILVEHYL